MSNWDIGAEEAAEELSGESDDNTAAALLGAIGLASAWMGPEDLRGYTASLVRDIRAGERLRLQRAAH